MPGLVAIYTGADYAADGLGAPKVSMPRKRPDGSPMFAPSRPALCVDRVRYVGDPVAMVVAESVAQAMDAAERIAVAYDALPSVTSTAQATLAGAPPVWDECPDNVSNFIERGNKAATDAAFSQAARVIRRRYVITRVHAQYMEPRGRAGDLRRGGGPADALCRRAISASRASDAGAVGVPRAGEQAARHQW